MGALKDAEVPLPSTTEGTLKVTLAMTPNNVTLKSEVHAMVRVLEVLDQEAGEVPLAVPSSGEVSLGPS